MKRRATLPKNPARAATAGHAATAAAASTRAEASAYDWVERAKLPAHRTPLDLPLLELECMKILWQLGEAPVSRIREILSRRRALAYTTVETLMNRLVKKGAASRRKQGAVYVYWPEHTREQVCQHALQRLMDHFFFGARGALQAYLGGKAIETPLARPPASQLRGRPSGVKPAVEPARRKAAKPRRAEAEAETPAPPIETSLL